MIMKSQSVFNLHGRNSMQKIDEVNVDAFNERARSPRARVQQQQMIVPAMKGSFFS
jgi:hypothetical protein